MQTIRPVTTDPIPLKKSSPKIGTIILRFVAILGIVVALLVWAWSR